LRAYDVFTFGETLIRLSTAAGERLETANHLEMRIGGTESNLAIALARLGRRVTWSSVLPRNAFGQRIARELRWHGVDVSRVHWANGGRNGVYFLETGSAPRPTQVLYDRRDSAVALADPETVDASIARDAHLLHLTGITPALSESCATIVRNLIASALAAGTDVSFDVNYRSLLWSPEQAANTLAPLCEQATILFCGREDAATIWNLTGSPAEIADGLADRFDPAIAVVTLGDEGAIARKRDGKVFRVASIPVQIIDQVGAGDAFAAGFLDGYLDGYVERGLQQGVALAALKMTLHGDLAVVSRAEMEAVLSRQGRSIIR
jgi:2-dehydro-3-deoxygluconokinase